MVDKNTQEIILLNHTTNSDIDYYYDKFANVFFNNNSSNEEEEENSHRMTIQQLLVKKVDAPTYKPSTKVEEYLKNGLDSKYARDVFLASGRNKVTNPQNCPGWLCCLLPCLNTTPKMLKYFSLQSDSTSVYRGGRRFLIDSENLIVGDLIDLYEGDIVPADCRIVEIKGSENTLQFNITVLAGILDDNATQVITNASVNYNDDDTIKVSSIVKARNICWVGSRIHKGSCKAIVINVGLNTLWSRLIASNRWVEK